MNLQHSILYVFNRQNYVLSASQWCICAEKPAKMGILHRALMITLPMAVLV
jgi:hypothetical protein